MAKATTPDAYFEQLEGDLAPIAHSLREMVNETAPDLNEVIKWGAPLWEGKQHVVWLKVQKKHITFGFFYGNQLNDPDGLLEGEGKAMRHLKIRKPEDVETLKVQDFVVQSLALDG